MNKQTIFSVTLFDSTYTGDLESIIKGCKNIYQRQPSEKRSNNHGYQSTDDLHTHRFMQPVMDWICEESVDAFNHLGCPKQQIFIEGCWFNINQSLNAHNQIHIHSGILSGVFYLQAPQGSGDIKFINTGFNQLWQGTKECKHPNSGNAFSFNVKPTPGKLYLWPSYLYHCVDSNHTEVERLSISFNLR